MIVRQYRLVQVTDLERISWLVFFCYEGTSSGHGWMISCDGGLSVFDLFTRYMVKPPVLGYWSLLTWFAALLKDYKVIDSISVCVCVGRWVGFS